MAGTPPLCLTMGEPAGIGGEIAIKAWAAQRTQPVAPFFMIDRPERLQALSARIGIDIPIAAIAAPRDARFNDALPVLPLDTTVDSAPGRLDTANAAAVIESITRGHGLVIAGEAAALVTNPIQKSTLYAAGFSYPGHTEFLAALAKSKNAAGDDAGGRRTARSPGDGPRIAAHRTRCADH